MLHKFCLFVVANNNWFARGRLHWFAQREAGAIGLGLVKKEILFESNKKSLFETEFLWPWWSGLVGQPVLPTSRWFFEWFQKFQFWLRNILHLTILDSLFSIARVDWFGRLVTQRRTDQPTARLGRPKERTINAPTDGPVVWPADAVTDRP